MGKSELDMIWLIPVIAIIAWTVFVYRLGETVGRENALHPPKGDEPPDSPYDPSPHHNNVKRIEYDTREH